MSPLKVSTAIPTWTYFWRMMKPPSGESDALKVGNSPSVAATAFVQYARGRAIVTEALRRCPRIEFTDPQGAFYAFPRLRGPRSSLAFA